MHNEPIPTAPAAAAAEPAPTFTHRPRRANFSNDEHAWQHRFGASEWESIRGIRSCDGSESTASVFRAAHRSNADLRINIGFAPTGSRAEIRLALDPAGLRELARCLIDAAHDLDIAPAHPRAALEVVK